MGHVALDKDGVVGGQGLHHLVPAVVAVADERTVAAVGAGILDVFLDLRFDDGQLVHIRVKLRHDNGPGGHAAVDHNGVVVDDLQRLGAHGPFGAEALGHKAEIAAVHTQRVIIRVRDIRELHDLLVLQGRHAHQEGINIGHHDGLLQRGIQHEHAQQRDGVALAGPNDMVVFKDPVPRKAGRGTGQGGFVQAVGAYAAHAADLVDHLLDRYVKLDRLQDVGSTNRSA